MCVYTHAKKIALNEVALVNKYALLNYSRHVSTCWRVFFVNKTGKIPCLHEAYILMRLA